MASEVMRVAEQYREVLAGYGFARAFAEGAEWYPSAWRECLRMSRAYDVTPRRVAAMVATLSPRARWQTNLAAADAMLRDAASGRGFGERYGVLPANVAKATRVYDSARYSEMVTGPKVSPFYRNIIGDVDIVTVDTIMAKASGLGADVTPRVRVAIVGAVVLLAREYGLTPRDMQAAVWVAYRGRPD